MTKGSQKKQFEKGIIYLKQALSKKIPVIVGVDDDYEKTNDDLTTEHFIVIVGMGSDTNGNYFTFYDNATSDINDGTSSDNRLYCKCSKLRLEGIALNDYFNNTKKQKYVVSQIRESKKL